MDYRKREEFLTVSKSHSGLKVEKTNLKSKIVTLQLHRSSFGGCANPFPVEIQMPVLPPSCLPCSWCGGQTESPGQGRALELACHCAAGLGSGITLEKPQASILSFITPCRMGSNDLLLCGPRCPHPESGDSRAACGMALSGLCK